ncbi:Aristolochene synthase [Cladobotryum mycophilum]|uniref:Terpene synthase n=1 Tax=Cladobotryum mycophilum TaxID=491253 RepID=A0ABR0T402_9HYPO
MSMAPRSNPLAPPFTPPNEAAKPFSSPPSTNVLIPLSKWAATCHPMMDQVTKESNEYFLIHWHFPSEESKQKFLEQDLTGWVGWDYPTALPSRLLICTKYMTYFFLTDDMMETMSISEGKALSERLIAIAKGEVEADRGAPVEYIVSDLWDQCRAIGSDFAHDIEETTFEYWRYQASTKRITPMGLRAMLDYRRVDIAAGPILAFLRFVTDLWIPSSDSARIKVMERNYANHLAVVNDLYSLNKELRSVKVNHTEGATLINTVAVLANDGDLSLNASKRVLWAMVREWEACHDAMAGELLRDGASKDLITYAQLMRIQLSGNEFWSRYTLRYNKVIEE